jgi:hypothetical protein
MATFQYYIAAKGKITQVFGVHVMMSCVKCPCMKMYWHRKFRYDPIASGKFFSYYGLTCLLLTLIAQKIMRSLKTDFGKYNL